MNRIYKVIWSKVKHQYVVVSELAHSCTKSAGSRVGRSAAVLAALVLTTGLCAAPVQAEDLTDPYALLNTQVEETNSTSSDTLVTLVQSPLAKSVAPLANEDEGQPGEGGDTSGTTPTEPTKQHTIYNEEGFYAHNGNSTYNALTKDGLWVGGDDQTVGFHVDNEGNLFTNGTATFKQGADMGGQKITNVADGKAGNDAVNVSQLTKAISGVTYTGSDSVAISDNNVISVKTGQGVKVDENGVGIALKAGDTNLSLEGGLHLSQQLTGLTSVAAGSFGGKTGSFDTSVTVGGDTPITISGGKITGLTADIDGTNKTDAVNVGYLESYVGDEFTKNAYTGGNGITVTDKNIAVDYGNGLDMEGATDGEKKLVVKKGQGIKVDENGVGIALKEGETNLSLDGGLSLSKTLTELTSVTADSFGGKTGSFDTSVTVGGDTPITISGGKITGLTADIDGTNKTDAVNVGYLESYVGDEFTKNAYTGGNGITVTDKNIAVDYGNGLDMEGATDGEKKLVVKKGQGIKVDENGVGIALKAGDTNLSLEGGLHLSQQLTGLTSVAAGSFGGKTGSFDTSVTVGGDTPITISGGKITGLTADIDGTNKTDAVNVGYLESYVGDEFTKNAYTGGNGITVTDKNIAVDYGNGLDMEGATDGEKKLVVKKGQGIKVDENGVGIALKEGETNLSLDGGLSLSKTLTELTSVTADSFSGKMGSFDSSITVGNSTTGIKISNNTITGLTNPTGMDDSAAVNVGYLVDYVQKNASGGATYNAGAGIDITPGTDSTNPTISVANGNGLDFKKDGDKQKLVVKEGQGIQVNENGVGIALKEGETNLSLEGGLHLSQQLTGLTSVAAGSFSGTTGTFDTSVTVGGDTPITISGGKITGLTADIDGTNKTDAVNVGYLESYVGDEFTKNAYTGGNGITVTDKNIAVDYGNGLDMEGATDGEKKLVVKEGQGITVDGSGVSVNVAADGNLVVDSDSNALNLKDIISLEKVTATAGFYVKENGPSLTTDGLKIDENTSLTSTGLTTSEGTFSTSVTVGDTNSIQIGNGKISGLVTDSIKDDGDAVSVGYLNKYIDTDAGLAVQYDGASKKTVTLGDEDIQTRITNLAEGDINNANSTDAVRGSQLYATNQIVGDGKYTSHNYLINQSADNGMNLTEAVSALDLTIGDLSFSQQNVLKGKQKSVTAALGLLNEAVGAVNFDTGVNFIGKGSDLTNAVRTLDLTISNIATAVGVQKSEDGGLSTSINWDKFNNAGGTIVDTLRLWDKDIYASDGTSGIDWSGTKISLNASIITGIKELDGRVSKLEKAQSASTTSMASGEESNSNINTVSSTESSATSESAPTETASTEAPTAATMESAVAKAPAAANSMLSSAQPMTMALNAPAPLANGDPSPVENPNPDGSNTSNIHTEGDMTTVEKDFTVTGDATFKQGASMGDHKITDVAAGTEDTDGVNYGQLKEVQNQVDANSQNIGILGSAVNKLGDRIERVGAGAAALAALHPLDFDPDNKLDFAAGFGNYRGASAVAVGAFYRPSENVMFSVGGAFGGGEDMVNAGVSFKVGAGSGSATTSRTAMAKSLKSMQEVVASQDAQLAQQREQIDKLTAMVELLMEQNGQAQPKDGDAQAAQPQQ